MNWSGVKEKFSDQISEGRTIVGANVYTACWRSLHVLALAYLSSEAYDDIIFVHMALFWRWWMPVCNYRLISRLQDSSHKSLLLTPSICSSI